MYIENFIKANENELLKLNKKYLWSLNIAELKQAQNYFKKIKRNPTRAEIETLAQTWSEHCKHKTFSGPIKLKANGKVKKFNNLFKETIVEVTNKLNKKWCLSVFKDNAGIVEFWPKSKWVLAFKAETHNHPCAIEPYGGAETGVGGVIRDILGVGLGAKPILSTDNFCFGDINKKNNLKGFLSPRKILEGVVEGVRDYGNRMGIPTLSGGVYFDKGYNFNPLVYVGCVGILPKNKIFKKVKKNDLVVVIGGPTGRDGIHGATFSSTDIDEETNNNAVQIGHAINEKKVLDVLMKARDLNLYNAITDCGAGGFSSAIGELGEDLGVEIHLENAILKDSNIKSWEIWISESQERMVLSVKKEKLKKLKEICEIENCPICVLGTFDGSKKLKVFYKNEKLIDLEMTFLHSGLPKFEKFAEYNDLKEYKNLPKKIETFNKSLEKLISELNISSKKEIISQYDHEVQGGSILKPFSGKNSLTPTDSNVIWPYSLIGEKNNFSGFAVSHGFNIEVGKISPYKMSFYVIDEAVRNLLSVGADISKIAILDNFCSGNPNNKKILGEFVMASLGCKDSALIYETPFISGKDSFYNQSKINNKDYSIPLSLLISAIAPIDDVRKVISPYFKEENNPIYMIGKFEKGLGASFYSKIYKLKNNILPEINAKRAKENYFALRNAIKKDLILSAHDISKGGLAIALTKMSFDELTCDINLNQKNISEVELLFSESPSRILVEVKKDFEKDFLNIMKTKDILKLGYTIKRPEIIIKNKEKVLIKENIDKLISLWENKLNL